MNAKAGHKIQQMGREGVGKLTAANISTNGNNWHCQTPLKLKNCCMLPGKVPSKHRVRKSKGIKIKA